MTALSSWGLIICLAGITAIVTWVAMAVREDDRDRD